MLSNNTMLTRCYFASAPKDTIGKFNLDTYSYNTHSSGLEQPHLSSKQGCQIQTLKPWIDGRVMPTKDTLGHLQKSWLVYPSNLSEEHLTPFNNTYRHYMYFDSNTQQLVFSHYATSEYSHVIFITLALCISPQLQHLPP